MKYEWVAYSGREVLNAFAGNIVSDDVERPDNPLSRSAGFSVKVARWNESLQVQHPSDKGMWSSGCWEIRAPSGAWLVAPPEWRPKWLLAPCNG